MGNTDAKFKGQGKVLGTGEVVNAPKRKSMFAGLGSSTSSAASPAGVAAPKPSVPPSSKPKKSALSEEEKEERRKAAAAAAISRERAWEERISRQRARREQEESGQQKVTKAWNEGSIAPQNLPPADPALLKKQREAALALEKSGFNPYQATVASAGAARSAMTSGSADVAAKDSIDSTVSVEMMQTARKQLRAAMQGSDIPKLTLALQEAQKYGVPEIEEAQDLLTALIDAEKGDGYVEDELGEEAWADVFSSLRTFERTKDTVERKLATVAILQTLLRNLLDHPEEAKFRKIRLENKTIKEKIVDSVQGTAIGILEAVGFVRVLDEEGQSCLMVPDPSTLSPEIVAYAMKACEIALQELGTMKF